MALGALHALRERNLNVPDDVALAGFDDIPLARFLAPPLTTVRVEIADLGRRAVEMLLSSMEHSPVTQRELIPTTLVVRDSCGARSPSSVSETRRNST
jgi:LacI family transcriptional regulator